MSTITWEALPVRMRQGLRVGLYSIGSMVVWLCCSFVGASLSISWGWLPERNSFTAILAIAVVGLPLSGSFVWWLITLEQRKAQRSELRQRLLREEFFSLSASEQPGSK
jgi:hypothetical protein